MRYRYKIICSRLLVLIMVISSFQSAVAIEFGQNIHWGESQTRVMLLSDAHNMGIDSEHLADHSGENTSHVDCSAQCYVTFLNDSHTLFATRSKFRQKIVVDSSVFSSRYPNLPKRPPRT